jgi:glyoxylase-like metal-dependent hydrolase (beta-lactamase superfamily II)
MYYALLDATGSAVSMGQGKALDEVPKTQLGGLTVNSVVKILDLGHINVDKSVLTMGRGIGEIVISPSWAALIDHPEAKILVDTGFGDVNLPHIAAWNVKRSETQEIAYQLKGYGLEPDDIDIVINTHLHYDHCGNNALFKKSRFIVQLTELRGAYVPPIFNKDAYNRLDFDIDGIEYDTLEGDYFNLLPGIDIVYTPGHSMGHQSVMVKTAEGPIILPGDAVYTRENYEELILPGYAYDLEDSLRSIKRIKKLAYDYQGQVLFSHDYTFLNTKMKRVYGL